MRKNATGLALFALCTCLIAFQNCQKVSPQLLFSQSKVSETETEGGAQPYDGKVYVVMGDPCADQSRVHSKIILTNPNQASLVRENCQDIQAVALSSQDFQLSSTNPNQLVYANQRFENLGFGLDFSKLTPEIGFCFWMPFSIGLPDDTDAYPNISRLQIYEDGKSIGPAHSIHENIRNIGLGRFSHWKGFLRLSSSDNSDPRANGRTYTYQILDQPAP